MVYYFHSILTLIFTCWRGYATITWKILFGKIFSSVFN
ncbi:DUF4017 family protein [Verrucomicrobiota bacterium]